MLLSKNVGEKSRLSQISDNGKYSKRFRSKTGDRQMVSECLMLFLDIVMSVWLNAISGRAKSRTIPFPFLLFITILTFCKVFSPLPSVHYVKSTNPTPSLLQMTGRTVLDCRSLHGM